MSHRNSHNEHSNTSNNASSNNTQASITSLVLIVPELSGNLNQQQQSELTSTSDNNDSNNGLNAELTEVLVVANDTQIVAAPAKKLKALTLPPPPSLLPTTTTTTSTTTIKIAANEVKSIELPMAKVELNAVLVTNSNEAHYSSSIDMENAERGNVTSMLTSITPIAPIARAEDSEMCDCIAMYSEMKTLASKSNVGKLESDGVPFVAVTPIVRRSKSRVRTYLKRCRDRLTGQHHHEASQQTLLAAAATLKSNNDCSSQLTAAAELLTALDSSLITNSIKVTSLVVVEEDAESSYENIDFALPTLITNQDADCSNDKLTNDVTSELVDDLKVEKGMNQVKIPPIEAQLVRNVQMESRIEALMDSYLTNVFPRYFECTRAILIRQARDLLVCSFHGCLDTFEQRFLRKFTEIVKHLRHKHQIGESLLWCPGWPLVTSTGDLVLHLGALDEALIRPAEIYLCVKSDTNSKEPPTSPQLYAIWRTSQKDATIQIRSCCIDYFYCVSKNRPKSTTITTSITSTRANWLTSKSTPKFVEATSTTTYLSVLTLEMLSDDLTQLLQNLVIGVERSIGRISLNELHMPKVGTSLTAATAATSTESTDAIIGDQLKNDTTTNSRNKENATTPETEKTTTKIPSMLLHSNGNNKNNNNNISSPKCVLKRSELITKNKILGHKYMLRRLTNRQDSMNSTSSGNSCASSGSNASSEELILMTSGEPNNKTNKNESNKSNSSSPALPRFCLGGSFPHIDSDEDDEKRNSLECDQFASDIVPPTSITEIPEKLLTSGIYLPGTRDLKGQPIITIDASLVNTAALNCYEIATVLLYYSTIPESSYDFLTNQSCSGTTVSLQLEHQPKTLTEDIHLKTGLKNASTTTTTTNNNHLTTAVKSAQKTTTIITTTFTILIFIEHSYDLCVVDIICQSLKLLKRHIEYCEILVVCLDRHLLELCKNNATASTAPTSTITVATTLTKTISKNTSAAILNKKQQKQKAQRQQQPQQKQQQQQQQEEQQEQQQHLVKFISVDEVTTSVATTQLPHGKLRGLHHHDARKWREFFMQLEPFQAQCTAAGQRLVAAMCELRTADLNGIPTRRQLYAQHRALSRALMDAELHNLRKRGVTMLTHLQELANSIGHTTTKETTTTTSTNNANNKSFSNITAAATTSTMKSAATYSFNTIIHSHNQNRQQQQQQQQLGSMNNNNNANTMTSCDIIDSSNDNNNSSKRNIDNGNIISNIDVAIRLQKLTLLFGEVDRAAKRLEQLTEQRRERLRELTRQRMLEEEINELTSWITTDGYEALQRFMQLQMDCEADIKAQEQEFEKYYFISMKHLAKGRDLHEAAEHIDALNESAKSLKTALDGFSEKLEETRERIESATRLHHLLSLHIREENVQQEIQRLAEQIGMPQLLEQYHKQQEQEQQQKQQQHHHQSIAPQPVLINEISTITNGAPRIKPNSLNLNFSRNITKKSQKNLFTNSTPIQNPRYSSTSSTITSNINEMAASIKTASQQPSTTCHCWRESQNLEDMDELLNSAADEEEEDAEEEQSKIADSGLGGCDRCEGNPKLTRICSCQSLNDTAHLYDKSHNDDELDDECFEQPSKRYLKIHSPIEANAHLQCHASNLELTKLEELNCLDTKTQKTLLLIMREMIGTERDYVRSLYYVIENYVDELLRDDIPQPLRGQRNVIFGNIEKIFEFHNSHFLGELERYERSPLKVGAAFLEMESKFYLYALYNKNKPKSDTLMSEYGTAFFKSKQFELNDKMDLASYLLKPVQRMGKYALLLQQLVKACTTGSDGVIHQEIAADVEELQRAEEMVKFQLRHGNDLLAMDSLRDCDVNVKEQGRLLRQNEFLVWQGRGGRKSLRQIFLFEELVLFSKARRFPDHKNLDIYIYKNSIKTSDIGLTAHVGDSPTKFEIWFRKRKPEDTWTLQCMSEDIKNAWAEEISKLLWKQAKRNREIRLAEMSSMGIGSKPCLDIRPSNNQINDRSITISQLSKAPKLRHSFVGLPTEQTKTSRRPNSLISESSMSSSTSTSSLSTGSSSGHERHGCLTKQNSQGLELINETQALMLSNNVNSNNCSNRNHGGHSNTNTMSSTSSGIQSNTQSHSHSHSHNYTRSYIKSNATNISTSSSSSSSRNHKRSTTLISQLSMESGILSDISVTPEQEHQPENTASWLTSPLMPLAPITGDGFSGSLTAPTTHTDATISNITVVRRKTKTQGMRKNNDSQKNDNKTDKLPNESSSDGSYMKQFEETLNI